MERTFIKDLKSKTGSEASISGWVDVRRDQGKMVFFDFRDGFGKVQCVVLPNSPAIALAKEIRPEWVLKIEGKMNAGILNGDIELEVLNIEVLNKSETPPFEINIDTMPVVEEARMKYRYLDLRTERMQKNIRMRDKVITFFREY